MNDLDERVRRAFDEVTAPSSVKSETLAYITASSQGRESACDASRSEGAEAHEAAREDPAPVFTARRGGGRRAFTRRAFVAIAACLALVAVGVGCFEVYRQPTAYVGIDVNPSIELGLNRFGIVVQEEALNDDGRALLDAVSLTNLAYDEALARLTESAAFAPYVQDDAFVEISVTTDDEFQKDELCAQSDAQLDSLPCRGSCHEVDEGTRLQAAEAGMGVGRYRAAVELTELDPSVTIEDCSHMSMRDLRDRIDACSDDEDEHGSSARGETGSQEGKGSGHDGQGAGRHGRGAEHGGGHRSSE